MNNHKTEEWRYTNDIWMTKNSNSDHYNRQWKIQVFLASTPTWMIPSSTAFTSGSSAPSKWMWNSCVSSRCEGCRPGNQEAHRPIVRGVLKTLLKILCSDACSSWSPVKIINCYSIFFPLNCLKLSFLSCYHYQYNCSLHNTNTIKITSFILSFK